MIDIVDNKPIEHYDSPFISRYFKILVHNPYREELSELNLGISFIPQLDHVKLTVFVTEISWNLSLHETDVSTKKTAS